MAVLLMAIKTAPCVKGKYEKPLRVGGIWAEALEAMITYAHNLGRALVLEHRYLIKYVIDSSTSLLSIDSFLRSLPKRWPINLGWYPYNDL